MINHEGWPVSKKPPTMLQQGTWLSKGFSAELNYHLDIKATIDVPFQVSGDDAKCRCLLPTNLRGIAPELRNRFADKRVGITSYGISLQFPKLQEV
jgi:hypothetical protein